MMDQIREFLDKIGLRRSRRRKIGRILKKTISALAVLAAIGFALVVLAFIYYGSQVPDPYTIINRRVSESTQIYDRTGDTLLFDVYGDEQREIVAFDEIGQNVKDATLAAEDDEFYSHSGLDWKGILRAIYVDVTNLSKDQGGSTITQQLVKNTLFGSDKKISRKMKEMVFAVQIERTFTKDEIFWMYLNQIPYGSTIYGIEAASKHFFGVSADELTNAQAAMLASLPKAPTFYSPHGNNTAALQHRTEQVLRQMHELEMLTEEELEEALAEELEVLPPTDAIQSPHFVIMVREYLIDKYGEDVVTNGGLRVVTTLDADLQEIAEEVVAHYSPISEETFRASNMALAASDPQTGQLLAMVGSRDYFDTENDGNFNVALAHRQPGSSFKPFAYATAFDHGYSDGTVLFDVSTEFNPNCNASATQVRGIGNSQCYNPRNYSGTFSGPVTMRQALARSLNIPAVKTLYLAGITETIQTATAMGITTLEGKEDRFGLALVLGGGEVRLVDMVNAYGVFANDGVKVEPSFILEVSTSDGRILEKYEKQETRVLDQQVARLINSVLSDNNARAAVFGLNSPLTIPGRHVAAKTGTTEENRDGWIIGYTPYLAAGMWGGNNDNSPMTSRGTGAGVVGPAWKTFMSRAIAGRPNTPFVAPDPIESNKTMLDGTYFGPQGVHNILFYADPSDPQGPAPANPYLDPQFSNWESAVLSWAGTFSGPTTSSPSASPTTTTTPIPTPTPSGSPVPVTF